MQRFSHKIFFPILAAISLAGCDVEKDVGSAGSSGYAGYKSEAASKGELRASEPRGLDCYDSEGNRVGPYADLGYGGGLQCLFIDASGNFWAVKQGEDDRAKVGPVVSNPTPLYFSGNDCSGTVFVAADGSSLIPRVTFMAGDGRIYVRPDKSQLKNGLQFASVKAQECLAVQEARVGPVFELAASIDSLAPVSLPQKQFSLPLHAEE